MIIKKYQTYKYKTISYFVVERFGEDMFYLHMFLLNCFGYLRRKNNLEFKEEIKTICEYGMTFDNAEISIDNENNIVYVIESFYDYRSRPKTPKIEELLETENFIELCKMGFLNYITMTRDNFMHLLLTWNKILDQLPPFALLYQDDKDWYDILSFDSKEAMDKFLADHTKKETN
ncbi:hypothetical protein KBC04_02740 [Candidatus Babeliales bacterium]|nr:hypothetical protein [Candidatus Babeliales bacterium]MBP9844030.1 hypothetical protein [Candidatus Babeliales bacterium]